MVVPALCVEPLTARITYARSMMMWCCPERTVRRARYVGGQIMSNRSKGVKNERRVDELYRAAGMWTYRPENASYSDNDLWNLFDLAAVDPRAGKQYLVQVKSNSTQGELGDFVHDSRPLRRVSGVVCHFIIIYDGQGGHNPTPASVRLARATADGADWVVDERDDGKDFGQQTVLYLEDSE